MGTNLVTDTGSKVMSKPVDEILTEMVKETSFAEILGNELIFEIFNEMTGQACKSTGPEWYSVKGISFAANPQRRARYQFTKQLIDDYKDWICTDWKGGNLKVLDYGCGDGIASQALAPHVSQIIGIDNDEAMVLIYNEIVKRQQHPQCAMNAYAGNLMPLDEVGLVPDDPMVEAMRDFDLSVISLGMDCFEILGKAAQERHLQLVSNLNTVIKLLGDDGMFLVIDIQKAPGHTEPRVLQLPGGYKGLGYHSQEIVDALEEIGMDEIEVIDGITFRYEASAEDTEKWLETSKEQVFFLLKAKKGSGYRQIRENRLNYEKMPAK